MPKYARRVDANHGLIRDALRGLGWKVMDLSGSGDGIPDLMVSVKPGHPHFLEIKDGDKAPSAQKLTDAQRLWHSAAWRITTKVRSLEEAVDALNFAKSQVKELEWT